jgi:MSHA biogenesis protein MshE
MLEMSNALVDAINQADPAVFVRVAREQLAGQTLKRDALRLVLAGRTTVQEAMRIGNEFEEQVVNA